MAQMNKQISNIDRKVTIRSLDGKSVSGYLNILGFDRLSDYLLHHNDEFIMIYKGGMHGEKTIFIFKKNIVLIEDANELETSRNKKN